MRDRTKDSKAAWLLAIGCVSSIALALIVPSGIRWLFIGSGVILFYVFADHLGFMATGIFRSGDMDHPPEVEKTSEAEVLNMRKSQMVGKVGRALTEMVLSGRGEVDGKMFDCIADQPVSKGEKFRVIGLALSELKVEKLNQSVETTQAVARPARLT